MNFARLLSWLCIALVLGVAGCGSTDPYVYKKDEFKRTAETFNKEPTDRDEVTICYNGMGTTDKQVEAIAQQECGKFAKQAVATGETFGVCPLMTPVEAQFACVADAR
jgi:hypothetical protein